MTSHCLSYNYFFRRLSVLPFKILKLNCCGLDVHKTWIYACIGITDSKRRTEYRQARFSSFSKGLKELCNWLAKYNCNDVCMESTGKYWIPVFNVLEKNNRKAIRLTAKMPDGSVTSICVVWSSLPLSLLLISVS